jgi:hypothetical protein
MRQADAARWHFEPTVHVGDLLPPGAVLAKRVRRRARTAVRSAASHRPTRRVSSSRS